MKRHCLDKSVCPSPVISSVRTLSDHARSRSAFDAQPKTIRAFADRSREREKDDFGRLPRQECDFYDDHLSERRLCDTGTVVRLPKTARLNSCRRGHITWNEGKPKNALLVKKRQNLEASSALRRIGEWLQHRDIHVLVEKTVKEHEFPDFQATSSQLPLSTHRPSGI